MLTGIVLPMPEEIYLILEAMKIETVLESGRRQFFKGLLVGKDCIVALSRVGKVASSVTVAAMIERFGVDRLIVCGVAGGIAPHLKTGDIVVANECVQHDLDARPLFPKFEAPLLDQGFFPCDEKLIATAMESSRDFLENDLRRVVSNEEIEAFSLHSPSLFRGQLCCGDQFIGSNTQLNKIRTELPSALCVEMEGGAVGQVCYEYGLPYVVIRTISDGADDAAHLDFGAFIEKVAKYYTFGVVSRMMERLG